MSNFTALVADDVRKMRDVLAMALEQCGCTRTLMARDGEEALEKIALFKPDIAFLDIEMPGKTGLDVLDQLRAENVDVFTVMVSGHSKMENVTTALRKGAKGFVVKPYSMQRVHAIIEKFKAENS